VSTRTEEKERRRQERLAREQLEARRVRTGRITMRNRDPFDDPFFKDFERDVRPTFVRFGLLAILFYLVLFAGIVAIVLGGLAIAGVI
jgi:hypothetical protein